MPPTPTTTDPRRAGVALVACLVAFALVLAGCDRGGSEKLSNPTTPTTAHDHDDDHEAAEKPKIDPCSLVTKSEAADVLGPVKNLTEDAPTAVGVSENQRVCAISLERDEKFGANVGVSSTNASGQIDEFERRLPGLGVEIPGLGDHAVWYEAFRMIVVQDGSEFLSIQLREVTSDVTKAKDQAVQLAKYAVPRLPSASSKG